MNAHSHADTVPGRLAADRLDPRDTRDGLRFARETDLRLRHVIRHDARREQVLGLADAGRAARQ